MKCSNGYGREVLEFDIILHSNVHNVLVWAVLAAAVVCFIMDLKETVIQS